MTPVNPAAQDQAGDTALHYICADTVSEERRSPRLETLRAMLECGCALNSLNNDVRFRSAVIIALMYFRARRQFLRHLLRLRGSSSTVLCRRVRTCAYKIRMVCFRTERAACMHTYKNSVSSRKYALAPRCKQSGGGSGGASIYSTEGKPRR